jgi:phage baseplate assembly protein W
VADLGTDIDAFPDLSESFALVEGSAAYCQAIARRCVTRQGALPFHPSYGHDLRQYLGEAISTTDLHRAKAGVEGQALQDERTLSATARVSFDAATSTLLLDFAAETTEGPHSMTLAVDQVTATILSQS